MEHTITIYSFYYLTVTIFLKLLIDIIALIINMNIDTPTLIIKVPFKFSDMNVPKTCITKKLWSNPTDICN